jgi:GNAT superfamily N-acetyltransferase
MLAQVSFTDAQLAIRHARSQRGFYRALVSGSSGARLIELDGVEATVVPVRPQFSIFNQVFYYEDATALEAALPALEQAYAYAGIGAWSVSVPTHDGAAAELLRAAGLMPLWNTVRMAAWLADADLTSRIALELVPEPSWELVAGCNDRAYGLPAGSMHAPFALIDDPAFHLYAAHSGDEAIAALITREQDGDCYPWFVATVPEAQRGGVAAELLRVAFRQAQSRGCLTVSGESTPVAEGLYLGLGGRILGHCQLWERRAMLHLSRRRGPGTSLDPSPQHRLLDRGGAVPAHDAQRVPGPGGGQP